MTWWTADAPNIRQESLGSTAPDNPRGETSKKELSTMKSSMLKAGSVWALAAAMVTGTVASTAVAAPAGMVSTQQLVQESRVDMQRAQVSDFLSRAELQAQLEARGVDVASAQARIGSLSPAELATLSAYIDELPAGEGVLETVLFLLVIFMLLDIAGVTDIFPGL